MGLSRREFAKAEGCTEGAVRYAIKQGRLVVSTDGTLDEAKLGRWMLNTAGDSKRRAKREGSTAQTAITQVSAQIPFQVAEYYGWNEPDFDPETVEGFGLMLNLKNDRRTDPESIGHAMVMHGVSLLQREAYRLGWRLDGPKTPSVDADPLGPEECLSDLTEQPLTFGLVRRVGCAMQSDLPDASPIDVNDPVIVAELMVFLASDILQQELKRRRREAGAVGPRDDK